jgi:hypothetical protein
MKPILSHQLSNQTSVEMLNTGWFFVVVQKCPSFCHLLYFLEGLVTLMSRLMIKAAKRNDIEAVKAIVVGVGVNMNAADENGVTALIWAARNGSFDCVKILLDAKADVKKGDPYGATPLHWASLSGHLDCVKVGCFVR